MKREINMKETRLRAFEPSLRSVDDKNRTIEFVASTETPDRYGDVIRVDGWETKAYMTNPVFLWAHNSREMPIGRTVKMVIEKSPTPALVQTIKFTSAEENPLGDQAFRLYKGGYLNAVSVGFRPTKRPKPMMDEEDNFLGFEFVGQELLELSAVPIPANPEALARGIESGELTNDMVETFFKAKGAQGQGEEQNGAEKPMKTNLQEVIGKTVETAKEFDERMAVYVKRDEISDFQMAIGESIGKAVREIAETVRAAIEIMGGKIEAQAGEMAKLARRIDENDEAIEKLRDVVLRIERAMGSAAQKKDVADLDAKITAQRDAIERGFKTVAKAVDVDSLVSSDKEFGVRFDALRKGAASESDLQNLSGRVDAQGIEINKILLVVTDLSTRKIEPVAVAAVVAVAPEKEKKEETIPVTKPTPKLADVLFRPKSA